MTGAGASALRISPGLVVGESDAGALALNDPEAAHQWIELVLSDSGEPWVTIVTREKSLRVDGASHMRYRLDEGTALKLPNNTLHVSCEIRMPQPSGVVIEVVPREVPGRAQDLMGPEWAEAIAAFREPEEPFSLEEELEPDEATELAGAARAARAEPERRARRPAPEPDDAGDPVGDPLGDPADDPDRTRLYEPPPLRPRRRAEAPTERDPRLDDLGVTVAEPRAGRRYRRRSRRGGRATALLASLAVIGLAIGGAAAVVFTLSNPLRPAGESNAERSFVDAPLSSVPDGPGRAPASPPAANPGAGSAPTAADGRTVGEPVGEPPVGRIAGAETPADRGPADRGPAGSGSTEPYTTEPNPAVTAPSGETVPADPSALAGVERNPAPVPDRSTERPGPAEAPGNVTQEPSSGARPEDQVALLPRTVPERQDDTSAEPRTQPAPAAPDTAADAPLDWRLVRARELLNAGYITFPPRDNAVDYVERLLVDDPGNRQALAMLQLCADRLIEAALRAHDQGMEYEARNTLEEVLGFDPRNERANQLWREWVGPR